MVVTKDIIQGCRKDDRKAQYALYRQCHPVLWSICRRYQSDEQSALASLNIGFFKILSKLDTYQDKVPFEAWIRRIMINTLIDEFRKSAKERNQVQYPDPQQWQVIDESAEQAAEELLSMEQLQAMIQKLPPTSRQVFNLFAIDGYQHAEIAEGLGISLGTSKWHLAEARKRLQKMVQEQLGTSSYYKSKTS